MSRSIYLASGNSYKLLELQSALVHAGLPNSIYGPDRIGGMPEVEETGSTFEENALLKARGLMELGPQDGWFLADDSGIEVDALGGRPGVISARYAGTHCDDNANNEKIIEEMKGISEVERSCRFRCILALVGKEVCETFSGACEGTLLRHPRGNGGFGYDPLFLPNESSCTFGEIPKEEKAKISHRARALAKLINWLLVYQ